MIKRFAVERYRNFEHVDLEFGKINIFIGPNNSGKSNLIDAMKFVADLYGRQDANKNLLLEAVKKRGWTDILNNSHKPGETVSFAVDIEEADSFIKNSFAVEVPKKEHIATGFQFTEENFTLSTPSLRVNIKRANTNPSTLHFVADLSNGGIDTPLGVEVNDSIFNQTDTLLKDPLFYKEVYECFNSSRNYLAGQLGNLHCYALSEITHSKVTSSQEIELPVSQLAQDGANFINVLPHLEEQYDFNETYVDILQEAVPSLSKVKPIHLTESMRDLQVQFGEKKFKFRELSAGTVKMFLMALLLYTPERYSALCLDEPELNLHPAWLKTLSKWMVRGSSFDQLFISTHSPDLLDGLTESFCEGNTNLYVFSVDGTVKQLLPKDLESFLNNRWELGDMYRVGEPEMGGWPW